MDVLTKKQRSRNMAKIRSRDTKPEKIIRSMVHGLGRLFRLYDKSLPGKPDVVLKRDRKIIFVHGCFWHFHSCRFGSVQPKTNVVFWRNKRMRNMERDSSTKRKLQRDGWKVLTVWECQIKKPERTTWRLEQFLTK